MGVAFALAYFGIVIIIIGLLLFTLGIGGIVGGIVMIVISAVKKAAALKIIGIILLILGIILFSIPVIAIIRCIIAYFKNKKDNAFFLENEQTDNVITVNNGCFYYNMFDDNQFTINEVLYKCITNEFPINDSKRGKAIANFKSSNHLATVYEYNHPCCKLLCTGKKIYGTEEDYNKLAEYYRTQEFSYDDTCPKPFKKFKIDNDIFYNLVCYNPEYVDVEDTSIKPDFDFCIRQVSADGLVKRYMDVSTQNNNMVAVHCSNRELIVNPYASTSVLGNYKVVNPKAKQELLKIAKQVKAVRRGKRKQKK